MKDYAQYMRENEPVNELEEEMSSDDSRNGQSIRLKNIYKSASDKEKELLDRAFICLCGWSLKTLIEAIDS